MSQQNQNELNTNLVSSSSVSSQTYKQLEQEVSELETIDNWTTRVEKMKEIRCKINEEQTKLSQLTSQIIKNNLEQVEVKKKKKQNLDNLVSNFKNADTLEEKIKLYQIINSYIKNIQLQLFDE